MADRNQTSSSTFQLTIGIAFVAFAGAVGLWAGSALRVVPPPRKGLDLDPSALNFGEVWEDERFHWPLRIVNHDPIDAHITNFTSSCSCTAIEPRTLTIPAGESRTVRLTLDITHRAAKDPIDGVRPFSVSIIPIVTDGGGGDGI